MTSQFSLDSSVISPKFYGTPRSGFIQERVCGWYHRSAPCFLIPSTRQFMFQVLKAVTSGFAKALRICTCRSPESHVFGIRGALETRMTTGLEHRGAFVRLRHSAALRGEDLRPSGQLPAHSVMFVYLDFYIPGLLHGG